MIDITPLLHRFRRRYGALLPREDIDQAVRLGCWLAEKRWDPKRAPFEAWAVRWVKGELRRALRGGPGRHGLVAVDIGSFPAGGLDPEQLVEAREALERFQGAIAVCGGSASSRCRQRQRAIKQAQLSIGATNVAKPTIMVGMDLPASPKSIREGARVTQVLVAARAGVSLTTVRLFEASPGAVRDDTRKTLSSVYQEMAEANGLSGQEAGK